MTLIQNLAFVSNTIWDTNISRTRADLGIEVKENLGCSSQMVVVRILRV